MSYILCVHFYFHSINIEYLLCDSHYTRETYNLQAESCLMYFQDTHLEYSMCLEYNGSKSYSKLSL